MQYQKNEGAENPTGDYHLDVRIYDAKKPSANLIGFAYFQPALPGKPVMVTGNLPYVLEVAAQNVDSDALIFNYAGQHWFSNSSQCNYDHAADGYEGGLRRMDCGFTIAAPAAPPAIRRGLRGEMESYVDV